MNNHKPTKKSNWPVQKTKIQREREDTFQVHLLENLGGNAKKGGQRARNHGFFMTTLTLHQIALSPHSLVKYTA